MPENKKHHYVPRFYLKLFSANGRSINLFNVRTQQTVIDGALKNQCYRNYFYGKDFQVEKALATLERQMSQIMNKVQSESALPSRGSKEHTILLLYILVQLACTAYSAEMHNELVDTLVKYLVSPKLKDNYSPEQIDSVKVSHKNPAGFALSVAVPHYPLLVDLKLKIIQSTCQHEFITSDTPVVFYNNFLSFRKFGSNTGLASKGLLIFFPINPKQLIILYDAAVYKVGSRKYDLIEVSCPIDIEQINRLQFVSAFENVYYYDKSFSALHQFKRSERYRNTKKRRMQVFQQNKTGEYRKELLTISTENFDTDLTLSFLKIIKSARKWLREFQAKSNEPAIAVRDETLLKLYRYFLKLVDAGKYNHDEFKKYLLDISQIHHRQSASPGLVGEF